MSISSVKVQAPFRYEDTFMGTKIVTRWCQDLVINNLLSLVETVT